MAEALDRGTVNLLSRPDRPSCIFPDLTDGHIPDSSSVSELKVCNIDPTHFNEAEAACLATAVYDVSSQSAIVAAWALTIAKYRAINEVSFYTIVNTTVRGTISSCRLTADENTPLADLFHQSRRHLTEEHDSGLQLDEINEHHLGEELNSEFSNIGLVFEDDSPTHSGHVIDQIRSRYKFVALNISSARDATSAYLTYTEALLSKTQAENLAATFVKVLSSLADSVSEESASLVGDVDFMSSTHIDQIWSFNADVPEPWMECFHDVVRRHAIDQTSALAVDAWDVQLTYGELLALATRLATYLQSRGVRPGVVVPLCFERSGWAVLSMLAVSMAGGAFLSIPPYLPEGRSDSMINKIAPLLLLTTSTLGPRWEGRVVWVPIDGYRIMGLPNSDGPPKPLANPSDMLYLIFTSGSTGQPKGCVISHSSFLTGALKRAPDWNFGRSSRVLQMLAHTFDMSLLEICTSLGSGACVCVPKSEEVEENLADCIQKYRVNHAVMTPSLARRLHPDSVPGLKTLCLGGEAFTKELVSLWSHRLRLFQFYGPSECSINSSTREIENQHADPLNIGPPNSAACWVVMPGNHNKLVPVGAIGELLVSGPIVGLGYFKDPIRTSQVFVNGVDFVKHDPKFRDFVFYKTGDLVRWNSDGTLIFCGRADTQVKLNGQRLELGEVEYHLALDPEIHLAVALVPKVGRCQGNLLAIIMPKTTSSNQAPTQDISILPWRKDMNLRNIVDGIRSRLYDVLPRYMVPTIWAFLTSMPMSPSGKVDRVHIRKWVESMSDEVFAEITSDLPTSERQLDDATTLEQQILDVWSSVLKRPKEQVGLDRPFVFLGGDSVQAQDVVARCRVQGIYTGIRDILSCQGVAEISSKATISNANTSSNATTLGSELLEKWRTGGYRSEFLKLGLWSLEDIEDVHPCSLMQEGMFIGQIRRPGAYHLRFFFKVAALDVYKPTVDSIKDAWRAVVQCHPGLRTVFVEGCSADAAYHSVILRRPTLDIRIREVPEDFTGSQALELFTGPVELFGKHVLPHRLILCSTGDRVSYLSWEVSHAIIDGAGLETLLRDFVTACALKKLDPGPSYREFVAYQMSRDTAASARYWSAYTKDSQPCMFPVRTHTINTSVPEKLLRMDFNYKRSQEFLTVCRERNITVACAIRAAWALVLRTYTSSDEVCFGYVSSGRENPVKNISRMIGLCLSVQLCRIRLDPKATLQSIAHVIQQDYIQSLPHHHFPLYRSSSTATDESKRPIFNTAISMEWVPKVDPLSGSPFPLRTLREQDDPTEYDIAISVDVSDDYINFGFLYWPSLTEFDMRHVGNALMEAFDLFIDRPNSPIRSLSLINRLESLPSVRTRSPSLIQINETVMTHIERKALAQPHASALVSWDGEFSYSRMTAMATRLAYIMTRRGVQRGDRVLICLPKSCRAVVTILAIALSGAVLIATTAFQRGRRIEAIINHSHPKVIIFDPGYMTLPEVPQVAVVPIEELWAEVMLSSPSIEFPLPVLSVSDIMTIIYTSGSTGEPKGIIMDHGSLATAVLLGHGRTFGFSEGTRTFQFASFTFDASLMEIFTTLTYGGCVCIPSEAERLSNIPQSISNMSANTAFFTPSVLRLIQPDEVPSLETIIAGGELMMREDVQRWASAVNLHNGYGPAETTIFIASHGPLTPEDDPRNMGYAVDGTRLWVTDSGNTGRLVPPGCIGELVVESRQVTSGYLDSQELTAASFIDPPEWLKQLAGNFTLSETQKLYKTGDLVRYNEDGTLTFIGRMDTQVKIHGQRIELSEVELHLRECWPEPDKIVVDVMAVHDDPDRQLLCAFINGIDHSTGRANVPLLHVGTSPDNEQDNFHLRPVALPASVRKILAERLPRYMIPGVIFAASMIPMTVSGKTDRKRLIDTASRFSAQELANAKNEQCESDIQSFTQTGETLRQLWGSVLRLDPETITPDDDFFDLGGDSIMAMKLVASARKLGTLLSVSDIFLYPTIRGQCTLSNTQDDEETDEAHDGEDSSSQARIPSDADSVDSDRSSILTDSDRPPTQSSTESPPPSILTRDTWFLENFRVRYQRPATPPSRDSIPFSSVEDQALRQLIIQAAIDQCQIREEEIEDMYPCTPLQEGMIALTAKQPGAYVSTFSYTLPAQVDLARLRGAWARVAHVQPILRTRIVQVDSLRSFQVVHHGIPVIETNSRDTDSIHAQFASKIGLGTPLCRVMLMKPNSDNEPARFVMCVHHAIYDGRSLPLLLKQVETVYHHGSEPSVKPFKDFVDYLSSSQEAAAKFWKGALEGMTGVIFPSIPHPEYIVETKSTLNLKIESGHRRPTSFTLATRLKLAWAITASMYANTDDVVFGTTSSGRGVPLAGIGEMVGPTIATAPMRIQVKGPSKVSEALQEVQRQSALMMKYEHLGLQNIGRLGPGPATACQFQTLLVIEAEESKTAHDLFTEDSEFSDIGRFDTYALALAFRPRSGVVDVEVIFDPAILKEDFVRRIIKQVEHTLHQIDQNPQHTIGSLNLVQPEEFEEMRRWNSSAAYAAPTRCVHDSIHEMALEQPDAPAVCSWDGSFSYKELDHLSSILAADLQRRGVGPERFVPLCFQKSKWYVVAQLAVMKAGGAFVSLSERAPESRLREILQAIQAPCILASEGVDALNWSLGIDVVVVGQEMLAGRYDAPFPDWTIPNVTPANALCVIFTSGTTGKPKGIILDHASYSSSAMAHIKPGRLNKSSRVLQFSGYEFDASIPDHLSTLLAGGCICIPSENDRMGRLSAAARKLEITWAVLTPSVARCISPQEVPTLETLALVGEPMSQADIDTWLPHVTLMNAYGVSECSIIATINSSVSHGTSPYNVGRPCGCACWVVDTHNHERLLPIGSIGELLIVGHTIGRGYLNDVEASAAAFIQSPHWLDSNLNSGGRVYKTGDLVYYHPDGSIQFVGRKDTQVKLRGQRIELSEVEHHLRQCLPSAFGVVVELSPATDDRPDLLVAFVCFSSARLTTDLLQENNPLVGHPTVGFLGEVQSVEAQLHERLPSYMVPGVFLPLTHIPLTKSGKTDRSLLREVLKSLPSSLLNPIGLDGDSKFAPSTETEKRLCEIWARVLKVDAEKIGVNKSFLRIGGDSITAMKIATECRAMGFQLSAADIFRHKTISELAARASAHEESSRSTWFPLSPAQQFFIGETPERQQGLHPSLFLVVENEYQARDVERAVKALVGRHEMLRACFNQSPEGQWMQSIKPRTDGCYRFDIHNLHPEDSVATIVQNTVALLDMANGPVMAASFINLPERQLLFLVAHDLVADQASIQIIRTELKDSLLGKSDRSPPKDSFRSWCEQQLNQESVHPASFLKILHRQPQIDVESSSGTDVAHNMIHPAKQYSFTLDERTSTILLTSANQALTTKPVELFYAALLHSFVKIHTDRPLPTIFAESDGRERCGFDLEVANAVGCFTTFLTTSCELKSSDNILETIRCVKDGLRLDTEQRFITNIPDNLDTTVQVLLRVRESEPHQQSSTAMPSEQPDQASPWELEHNLSYPFSEVTMITGKTISCHFLASPQQHEQVDYTRWVEGFQSSLITAAKTLAATNTRFTLSDFPLLRLTDERLDTFVNETLPSLGLQEDNIEDIYPCSDLQQGILLGQARHGHHYRPSIMLKLSPVDGSQPIELARLERAWQQVVNHHLALRTIFVNASGESLADQLVMKRMPVQIDDGKSASTTPSDSINRVQTKCEHSLILREVSPDHIICELQINHALMDARSLSVIQRDLALAYDGRLVAPPNALYRDYIAYVQKHKKKSTLDYWTEYLDGTQPCLFPSFHKRVRDDGMSNCRNVAVDICDELRVSQFCSDHGVSLAALFHYAWALVLRCYVQSQDVCFGYVSHGRDVPLEGIQDAVGAFVNLLVNRTRFDGAESILSGLKKSMDNFIDGLPHQHCALLDVHHSVNPSRSSLFNTVVSIRTGEKEPISDDASILIEQEGGYNVTEYDIVVEITAEEKKVSASFTFQDSLISDEQQALWVAQAFQKGLLEIIENPSQLLSELSLLGDEHREHLAGWNQRLPEQIDRCVHEIIRETCLVRQDAIAVSAWDGDFSYKELEELSTALATHLRRAGVGPEIQVPICFEKSKWAILAILATLKAGGAFVLLDPSYPVTRLQDICRRLNSKLVLASDHNITLASSLATKVVVVGPQNALWEEGPATSTEMATAVPENAAYVMFTSGSTGTPKGVTIEHRSLCSTIKYQIESFHLTHKSRVLQFASYAFDAAILDILATLCAGGRICVASDSERLDLVAAINQYDINWACLTSSVARILSPAVVPSLKTLVLAGETVTEIDISLWSGIDMIVAYGLTECAITCVVQQRPSLDSDASNIGYGQGAIPWIVDPQSVNQLLPLGAVGELVLEGPVVGRGYLGDDALRENAFIGPPLWRATFPFKQTFRFYKTGDLVRYAPDGSICYIGRKDSQIKLRGQRIELGDVETHVRRQFPESRYVLADVVNPHDGSSPYLAAFFTAQTHGQPSANASDSHESIFLPPTDGHRKAILRAREQLQKVIPSHMVPAVFLPISNMPIRLTGKVDSERLRNEAALLSRDELAAYTQLPTHKKAATSKIEQMLSRLLSELLGLPEESVGMDDSLFQLGGDSLTAMKLVSALYRECFQVSVKDIFSHPSISSLAPKVQPTIKAAAKEPTPFSLLPDGQTKDAVLPLIADQCQIHIDEIEDVYPATPLQESLNASTMKQQDAYIAEFTFETVGDIDLDKFKAAWNATSRANPILRTRIVQIEARNALQLVLRSDETIHLWNCIEDYEAHRFLSPTLGGPLLYVSLIKQNSSSRGYIFVLRMHHALYDSWSLSLILEQLDAAYRGHSLARRPFNSFVQSLLQRQSNADQFWKEELAGISAIPFPALPNLRYDPSPTRVISHHIPYTSLETSDMTVSSKLRLAWAITISKYTGSRDVIFGVTVAGRNPSVPGIDQCTGPTIATVPFRVCLNPETTIEDNLKSVQNKSVALIPFEQGGLQHISHLSADALAACSFQSLLVVQPKQARRSLTSSLLAERDSMTQGANFSTYAISMICEPSTDGITCQMIFDESVVPDTQAWRMIYQLESILSQFESQPTGHIKELDISPEDRKQIYDWNRNPPEAVEKCIHEIIHEKSLEHPGSVAVCSWDGDFTYKDLNLLSFKLAQRLVRTGLGREKFVPVYMSRSRWTVVAVLGILRAGAAFVLLDPAHESGRHRDVCKLVQATLIVSSTRDSQTIADYGPTILEVGEEIASWTDDSCPLPIVRPTNAAYAIFTSGTTGTPKGTVIEHVAFATSAAAHSSALRMEPASRVLHHASYAFDAAVLEILTTLSVGACICIPSEVDRSSRMHDAIVAMNVNWVCLTPTLSRILEPEGLSCLQTLVLAGEAPNAADIAKWSEKTQLILAYGLSECAICCTATTPRRLTDNASDLGDCTGCVAWIVDENDHARLAPIGSVGELLIEGSIISRGYLDDPDRTAASFVGYPEWLTSLRGDGGQSKLYRTGDLVRYSANGRIQFVGRKDTQVKLRGQRLELTDVEHHVRIIFPGALMVIADVVVPSTDAHEPMLVAFIWKGSEGFTIPHQSDVSLFAPPSDDFHGDITKAEKQLKSLVPPFMRPNVYLPLSYVPFAGTSKIDRGLLRRHAERLSREQIIEYRSRPMTISLPTSRMESHVRELVAGVLGLPVDNIGLDDDFFHLGGDSIAAMKLTGAARQASIDLTAVQIFSNPILSDLASVAKEFVRQDPDLQPRPAFRGLSDSDVQEIAADWEIPLDNIVDILSTTEFQREYIRTQKSNYFIIPLPIQVDRQRMEAAVEVMVERCALLRTVFVPFRHTFMQIVLKEPSNLFSEWTGEGGLVLNSIKDLCHHDSVDPVSFGTSHFKAIFVPGDKLQRSLVFRLSHAQYDAVSMSLLLEQLMAAYHGIPAPPTASFAHYLSWREDQDHLELARRWKDILHGSQMTYVPSVTQSPGESDGTEGSITVSRNLPSLRPVEGFTMATMHKAAWALVLARRTRIHDLVFGQVTSGRNSTIDLVMGACVHITPVRVTLQAGWETSDVLRAVQSQHMHTMALQAVDFEGIVSQSTKWPENTRYGSVVQHQNIESGSKVTLDGVTVDVDNYAPAYVPSSIYSASGWEDNCLKVSLSAPTRDLNLETASDLLEDLCNVLLYLSHNAQGPVLDGLGMSDILSSTEGEDI